MSPGAYYIDGRKLLGVEYSYPKHGTFDTVKCGSSHSPPIDLHVSMVLHAAMHLLSFKASHYFGVPLAYHSWSSRHFFDLELNLFLPLFSS